MSASVLLSWALIPLLVLSCAGPAIEVDATSLVPRTIESALSTNGRIEATDRVSVHTAISGRIEQILVRRGDRVEKGQDLVRLADSGQLEMWKQAQARLAAAKARLVTLESGLPADRRAELESERSKLALANQAASQNLQRLERLVLRDAAAQVDLDAAKRVLDEHRLSIKALDVRLAAPVAAGRREESEAVVREAEAAVAVARNAVSGLTVTAPASGLVYSLPVSLGDHVEAGGLMARMGYVDNVRARIFVDEPDLGRVRNGSLVSIRTDAYPGQSWTCRVDGLAVEIVEMGTRRVGEVQCTVENQDGRLLPNLAIAVRIVTARVEAAPSLPRRAVHRTAGQAYVWTVAHSEAVLREIDTGVEGPAHIEVLSGLDDSEPVLLPAADPVVQGRRVRIREQ